MELYVEAFINYDIPALRSDDAVSNALRLMDEYRLNNFPVVSEDRLLAVASYADLAKVENKDAPLKENISAVANPLSIPAHAHPYEAAVCLAENHLDIISVLDEDNNYLGIVTQTDIFPAFFNNSGLNHPGSLIILQLKPFDYSLSEIARICESCDIHILNLQIFPNADRAWIDVVLKTNKKDLQALEATFERFEYQVKKVYGALQNQEDLIERYRLLMNYINM